MGANVVLAVYEGMCRQFIREFSDNSLPIFMYGKEEGECIVRTLGEVCCRVFIIIIIVLLLTLWGVRFLRRWMGRMADL